jgi:hypothetical protein
MLPAIRWRNEMARSRNPKQQERAAKGKELPRSLMARLAALAREQALEPDKKQPKARSRRAA